MIGQSFSIAVADIEREETVSRDWALSPAWLNWALDGTDATSTGVAGELSVTLYKNGRDFLVRGTMGAQVQLPCARTLDPAIYDVRADLVLILHKRSASTLGKRESPPTRGPRKDSKKEKDDGPLSDDDAASDTFAGDHIFLDQFVREQLLLELPMFPLRSDLRSSDSPAISPPPQPSNGQAGIDPRLLPLQALAEKLKTGK